MGSWRGALWCAVLGTLATLLAVLACHTIWKASPHLPSLTVVWASGLGLTVLASGIARATARLTYREAACRLDRNLDSKNRLEAVAELPAERSPLGHALHEEAAGFLGRTPSRRTHSWATWVALLTVVLLAHLFMVACWVVPSLHWTPPPPAKAGPIPTATITWKIPEPESKANAVDEVPTVATVQSSSGLQDLHLEIAVNGETRKSIPIADRPYRVAGQQVLKVSMYLDELGVRPYDLVSYYVHGQRIASQPLPETASTMQFIEVRPFRKDVVFAAGGNQSSYDLLIRLKLAQLRLIKQNFVLTHTDLAKTDAHWIEANGTAAHEQMILSQKCTEAIEEFIKEGMSAEVVDLLKQVQPMMVAAAQDLEKLHNQPALDGQEQALSRLIAVEKYFREFLSTTASNASDKNPSDPFRDRQLHDLKPRSETRAGELEQLAAHQAHLAQDLSGSPAKPVPGASSPSPAPPAPTHPPDWGDPAAQAVDPFGPGAEAGTWSERQVRVLQGVTVLLNQETPFPAKVVGDLQAAQNDGRTSLRELDSHHPESAREPALVTAQDLQRAVRDVQAAGEKEARQALLDTQQALDDLAQKTGDLNADPSSDSSKSPDALAAQLRHLEENLANEAAHQQEAGSAASAADLQGLASEMSRQGVLSDLQSLHQNGHDVTKAQQLSDKLQALAAQAARGAGAGQLKPEDLNQLVEALQHSQTSLAHLAAAQAGQKPSSLPGDNTGSGKNQPSTPGSQPMGAAQAAAGSSPSANPETAPTSNAKGSSTNPPNVAPLPAPAADPGAGRGQEAGAGGASPDHPTPDLMSGSGTSPGPGVGGASRPQEGTSSNTIPVTHREEGAPDRLQQAGIREALVNLQIQSQQAEVILTDPHAKAVAQKLLSLEQQYRPQAAVNVVVAYQAIEPPLRELISLLQVLQRHSRREEAIRQPELDESPPAYRSAVSDYFESLSRDYHPDAASPATSQP